MTSSPDRYWEDRNQLTEILSTFDLNVFEWLCLEASAHWVKWDSSVADSIYRDVVLEDFWSYGSGPGACYLPDITRDVLERADAAICSSGLVSPVDRQLAEAMIAERASYDPDSYTEDELLGLRVLSDAGQAVWHGVRGLQGYWEGFRFIKLLSKQHNGMTNTGLVFHSPHQFHPELVCESCAAESQQRNPACYSKVGPWFDKDGCQVWLEGWRLVCPHAV